MVFDSAWDGDSLMSKPFDDRRSMESECTEFALSERTLDKNEAGKGGRGDPSRSIEWFSMKSYKPLFHTPMPGGDRAWRKSSRKNAVQDKSTSSNAKPIFSANHQPCVLQPRKPLQPLHVKARPAHPEI